MPRIQSIHFIPISARCREKFNTYEPTIEELCHSYYKHEDLLILSIQGPTKKNQKTMLSPSVDSFPCVLKLTNPLLSFHEDDSLEIWKGVFEWTRKVRPFCSLTVSYETNSRDENYGHWYWLEGLMHQHKTALACLHFYESITARPNAEKGSKEFQDSWSVGWWVWRRCWRPNRGGLQKNRVQSNPIYNIFWTRIKPLFPCHNTLIPIPQPTHSIGCAIFAESVSLGEYASEKQNFKSRVCEKKTQCVSSGFG